MKRNTLTTAVLAGLTGMAGMVSVSNAVNVNPDGLGEVLMYPYYTARGGNDTLISIVNTTERGKAVKIRVLEALNSREVLDFNIYMSEWDVWTAAITASATGGGKIITADSTCTSPNIYDPVAGFGEIDFLDFQYTGPNSDEGPQELERSLSGHLEFIEMGTFLPTPAANPGAASEQIVPWSAKHVGPITGPFLPNNCQFFENQWVAGGIWAGGNTAFGFEKVGAEPASTGGLFGGASIINVGNGTMFSYNATAVDAFWLNSAAQHSDPSFVTPSLASGGNTVSNVFVDGAVATHDWPFSVLAVNATVTFETLMNEYNVENGLGSRSEWVLTFPTKRFHTDAEAPVGTVFPNAPIAPFSNTWHDTAAGLNLPCEALTFRFWDREEQEPDPSIDIVIPSPPPPNPAPNVFELCRETNVVRFSNDDAALPAETEILKETLRSGEFAQLSYTNFELPERFENGWVRFNLTQIPAGALVAAGSSADILAGVRRSPAASNGDQIEGLPVIGFWVNTYTNGALPGGTLANYGGTFDHHGSRSIFTP